MSLSINPDLGDTIVIDDQGVAWTVDYEYKDTDFNGGLKGHFQARFPRDFGELSVDGELEQAMMTLAMAVARAKNVHS